MILSKKILLCLFIIICASPLKAQESEEDISEKANELFAQEEYEAAFKLYSTLLSIELQNPEYNYRFGACQLFTSEDKEEPLKYLKFATEQASPPALAYFYYGLGLHLNYQFDKAIRQYEKYKPLANRKENEADLVDHHIQQCKNGKTLVSSFTDISVIQRTVLPRTDFYRNYDLSEFGGKIIVKPEDFMSEEDKKRDAKFLMYFQEDADLIYYASYSDKNATGKDLYSIQKLPGGEWSTPTKLDATINTSFNEDYPFIHPEGNKLYFASEGHNSMGGYDIFKSERRGDGSWSKPVNMEFAINTPWDDFMFITDLEENSAWFASNRETTNKQVTVYRIGIERIPLDLTLIKGVFEAEGSKKATITVEDMIQDKVVGTYESERQLGGYLLDLKGSGQYKFIVEAEESNAIHTGVVEIPREKGLKQFRQEMKLVEVDGKEQLQIINHFDEPIEDEQLLTADILRKQASLSVNASKEDIEPETDSADEGGSEESEVAGEGLDKVTKLALAKKGRNTLQAEAEEMEQKASALYETVQSKYNSEDPDEIAEAAIAAELASTYKSEAERRKVAVEQMNGAISIMENSSTDDAAFNARYTQLAATQNNFKPMDAFEQNIENEFEKRMDPTLSEYEGKVAEVDELKADIEGINEEIAYYQDEITATDDDVMKAELEMQISEAKAAKPVKVESLERAKKELVTLDKQQKDARKYNDLAGDLLVKAAQLAPSMTNVVSSVALNEMQNVLDKKAAANPALVAMITPKKASEALANNLKDSRSEEKNKTDKEEVASEQGKKTEPSNEDDIVTTESQNENQSDQPNSGINEEIERIEAQESEPEVVSGDLETYFAQQLDEASQAEDPIIEESSKAELYDSWAENIQLRIDSLEEKKENTSDQEEVQSIDSRISDLNAQKEEKEDLAMASYQRIATLSDAAATASQTQTDNQESDPSDQPSSNENTEVPPITEDLLADEGLPQSVETINDQFADEMEALEASMATDSSALKTAKADAFSDWADELQKELDIIAQQINSASSIEEKNILEQKAAAIGELRMEKVSKATELRKSADAEKEQVETLAAQSDLQRQLYDYVENYNRSAFTQIEDQIEGIPDEQQRKAQLETLNKNWLIALQNEQVKKEARLSNSTDENQSAEIQEQLAKLTTDKKHVRQTLDSLNAKEKLDQPSAPKNVYVSGSERFEGYTPVDVESVTAYEENAQKNAVEADEVNEEIAALQNELQITNKKKERAEIQNDIAKKEAEQAVLSMKSSFYGEAAQKLAAVESQVLTMTANDSLPSINQSGIAEEKAQNAQTATEEARVAMEDANAIKKRKEREPAIQEAQKLQNEATLMRQEADLAKKLAKEMKMVEDKTIAQNFIILPSREVVLPVVRRELNPTEIADVSSTDEFEFYQREMQKTDSIRQIIASIEADEKRLTAEGKQLMEASASSAKNGADMVEANQLTEDAYSKFERSDSLSKMAARLTRQASYIENEANRSLLTLPEEAYMNILAYYNSGDSDTSESVVAENNLDSVPTTETDTVESAAVESDTAQASQTEEPPIAVDEQVDTQTESSAEEPFDLNPPTEDEQPKEIAQDELTNTIFEIEDQSAASNYSESNPIPVDPPLPTGLMYKVQIGAFRNRIQQDVFKGIAPIVGETAPGGLTRYSAGEFNTFSSADNAKERIQDLGYSDAFVVAYYNGKRISISQARSIEQGGPAPQIAGTPQNRDPRPVQQTQTPVKTEYIKQGAIEISSVENTRGTFFTVQVGVFSNPVSPSAINNITPLQQENLSNGTYRYSTGKFNSVEVATKARNEARALGISDAFVTAYRDGKRITVAEAGGSTPTTQTAPTPQPTTNSDIKYRVLIGTFTDRVPVNVASKILTLGDRGIEKVENADGSKSYYYGSFNSEQEAESAAQDLRNDGLTNVEVVSL